MTSKILRVALFVGRQLRHRLFRIAVVQVLVILTMLLPITGYCDMAYGLKYNLACCLLLPGQRGNYEIASRDSRR